MPTAKPNTICKNKFCTRGKDGGRKHYYSCLYCLKTESWRSVACCPECYAAYLKQVRDARNCIPERTDMNQSEIQKVMKDSDSDDLLKKSRKDISEILGYDIGPDIESGIEKVNELLEGKQ